MFFFFLSYQHFSSGSVSTYTHLLPIIFRDDPDGLRHLFRCYCAICYPFYFVPTHARYLMTVFSLFIFLIDLCCISVGDRRISENRDVIQEVLSVTTTAPSLKRAIIMFCQWKTIILPSSPLCLTYISMNPAAAVLRNYILPLRIDLIRLIFSIVMEM